MKRFSAFIIAVILSLAFYAEAFAAPDCSAEGAVLIEAETGRILFESGKDLELPMASTTKVMTAILAIENGDLESVVTVSKNASGIEGSSIWLEEGEHMTLEDMLFGLMLSSGNDAAVAIAEHISGSVDAFCELMNEKAKEIGALNTHFANPNGLPNDEHYTTAYDLARIAAYAMKNETFRTIVSTEKKEISWEGHEYNRVLNNKNKILWQYEGGNGVKTGYTKKAGKCLVFGAEREGMQLIGVILNAPNMFPDAMSILDYGFENYAYTQVISKDDTVEVQVENGLKESVSAAPVEDIYLPLTQNESNMIETRMSYTNTLTAPVDEGTIIGQVEVFLEGTLIASADIATLEAVEEDTIGHYLKEILLGWLGMAG